MVAASNAVAPAHPSHGGCGRRVQFEHGEGANQEVDPRRHHGGRVDQCGDRSGAFHRIGQPNVERQLGRFAKGTSHQEEGDDGHFPATGHRLLSRRHGAVGLQHLEQLAVFKRAKMQPGEINAKGQSQVTDAVDDEGFLGRRHRRRLGEVVANQHVRSKAHAFPAEVQGEQVVSHDQATHRQKEDGHSAEEAAIRRANITLHVLTGIERDQGAQAGHKQHPQQRQTVEVQTKGGRDRTSSPRKVDPLEQWHHHGVFDVRLEVEVEHDRKGAAQAGHGGPSRKLGTNTRDGVDPIEDHGDERQSQHEAGVAQAFRRQSHGEVSAVVTVIRSMGGITGGNQHRQQVGTDHASRISDHTSASRVGCRLKRSTTKPKAKAASAAAIVRTKITMTCPERSR